LFALDRGRFLIALAGSFASARSTSLSLRGSDRLAFDRFVGRFILEPFPSQTVFLLFGFDSPRRTLVIVSKKRAIQLGDGSRFH